MPLPLIMGEMILFCLIWVQDTDAKIEKEKRKQTTGAFQMMTCVKWAKCPPTFTYIWTFIVFFLNVSWDIAPLHPVSRCLSLTHTHIHTRIHTSKLRERAPQSLRHGGHVTATIWPGETDRDRVSGDRGETARATISQINRYFLHRGGKLLSVLWIRLL